MWISELLDLLFEVLSDAWSRGVPETFGDGTPPTVR